MSPDQCQRAVNRAKGTLPDYWNIANGTSAWTDTDFGHETETLIWKSQEEETQWNGSFANRESSITWARAYNAFDNNTHTIRGNDEQYHFEDIDQGYIGNCWFLAAAIALAEKPGRLEKVFVNQSNDQN